MKKKYKMSMIIILIVITFLIIVGVGYNTYLSELNSQVAIVEVKEGLSINYLNGNKVKTEEEDYEIDFSVTNMESEDVYYSIKLNTISSSSDVTYKLLSDNVVLNDTESSIKKSNAQMKVKVEAGKTQSYNLIFYNPTKELLETEVLVDLENVDFNLKNIILSNNEVKPSITSFNDGSSDEDTGLIELSGEDGMTYYYRGNVVNNYVSLGNLMWRIVKINSDGTVQLVLDSLLEDNSSYFATNEEASTNFLDSDIYKKLDEWYSNNLLSVDDYIASSKYCIDDNAFNEDNGVIYYLANNRLLENFNPVVNCPGTPITTKIALLSGDEVMLAGSTNREKKDYYLINDGINRAWWTMSLSKKDNGQFYYIVVGDNGGLDALGAESSSYGIRPSITVIKKVSATGSGTIDDPYVLSLM